MRKERVSTYVSILAGTPSITYILNLGILYLSFWGVPKVIKKYDFTYFKRLGWKQAQSSILFTAHVHVEIIHFNCVILRATFLLTGVGGSLTPWEREFGLGFITYICKRSKTKNRTLFDRQFDFSF